MSADPVTLKVSQIGELAVYAAVNALCAEKIRPESFRPVILLPRGAKRRAFAGSWIRYAGYVPLKVL